LKAQILAEEEAAMNQYKVFGDLEDFERGKMRILRRE
jgi:hypothetical protein